MPYLTQLCLCLFLLFPAQVFAQVDLEWLVPVQEKHLFGNSLSSMASADIVATPDGRVYACGLAASGSNHDLLLGREELPVEGPRNLNHYLAAINADGTPAWIKAFSATRFNFLSTSQTPKIVAAPNGGIIIASIVRNVVEFGTDTLAEINARRALALIYVSPSGEVNDLQIIPSDLDDLDQVILARNGDLLISGRFRNNGLRIGNQSLQSLSSPAYFTARIDPTGRAIWATPITAELKWRSVGDAYGLLETSDGNIIISISPGGYNYSINGCASDPHFFSLASFNGNTGDLNWQREIATHGFGFISDLAEAPNGDLYAAGRYGGQIRAGNGETAETGNLNCDIESSFLLKLTPEGFVYDLVSNMPSNFAVSGFNIFPDGTYALAGWSQRRAEVNTSSLEPGYTLMYFDAYDQLLSQINLTKPRGAQGNYRLQMTSAQQKNLVLTGQYLGTFLDDVFIDPDIDFDFSGKMFISKVKLTEPDNPPSTGLSSEDVTLFPNPATNILNINTPKGGAAALEISLFDVSGRRVRYYPPAKDRSQHTIDLRQLPTGAYVLRFGDQAQGISYPVIKRKDQ